MKIRHVDHIGIVVKDLEATKVFFVDFYNSAKSARKVGTESNRMPY